MRRLAPLLLVSLAGCGGGDHDDAQAEFGVRYVLEGALRGPREIREDPGAPTERVDGRGGELEADAFGGARVSCALVSELDREGSRGVLVVSALENYGERHGAGIYLRVVDFRGVGRYALDAEPHGRVWVFDDGHVQACVRDGDASCFQGNDGCEVEVSRWEVSPDATSEPAGVAWGVAHGTFRCRALGNATTGATVRIAAGEFHCRAGDWTRAGQPTAE